MNPVTVIIPIGPNPIYLQYLPEAIESVLNQTVLPGEVLLVDDGSSLIKDLGYITTDVPKLFPEGLSFFDEFRGKWVFSYKEGTPEVWVGYWKNPWNIGFAQTFNCGVGLALYDNILYLAADDTLAPTAVEDCLATWNEHNQKDAWYALTYKSYPSGKEATLPINAAMITKNLWKWLKGFPPSAFAGPDALLLSILMVHASDRIIKVAEGKFNYFIREHPDQETHHQASFFLTEMDSIRNKETARFKPNENITLK